MNKKNCLPSSVRCVSTSSGRCQGNDCTIYFLDTIYNKRAVLCIEKIENHKL